MPPSARQRVCTPEMAALLVVIVIIVIVTVLPLLMLLLLLRYYCGGRWPPRLTTLSPRIRQPASECFLGENFLLQLPRVAGPNLCSCGVEVCSWCNR